MLDVVIDANPEHRDALRALFADTRVTSVCACGCGSPDLATDYAVVDPSLRTWRSPLPGQAAAKVDGVVVIAVLFDAGEEGALLDLTWHPTTTGPTVLLGSPAPMNSRSPAGNRYPFRRARRSRVIAFSWTSGPRATLSGNYHRPPWPRASSSVSSATRTIP